MQIIEPMLVPLPLGIDQHNRQVRAAELRQDLQAQAARCGWWLALRDHDNGDDLTRSRGDCRANSDSLGTDGRAKTPILDVASTMDLTAASQQRRTNAKAAVGSVGSVSRLAGYFDQFFPIHWRSIYHGP